MILPVLMPDGDLDWARYEEHESLVAAPRGLLEPIGPRLGVDAIAHRRPRASSPASPCRRAGTGSAAAAARYDRALGRVPVGTPTWVLLYDGEVGRDVPVEPHDRRVTAAVTPSGIHRF